MLADAPQADPSKGPIHLIPAILTVGFGVSVAMATIAYLLRLPGLETSPALVGWSLILVLAAAAFVAGRSAARLGWAHGAGAALVAAIVSLIVVLPGLLDTTTSPSDVSQSAGAAQSPQRQPAAEEPTAEDAPANAQANAPSLALAVPGWLTFAALVGALGGFLGGATRSAKTREAAPASPRRWLFRFSLVACAAVAILLLIGGVVTSAQEGLAVPDWPTSFGANMFLLPLSSMTGGVFLEHSHRLFGALTGLTIAALAGWTIIADRRKSALVLAALAFILVSAQGIMGGLRVTQASVALAAVHGFTAQAFFAFMCVYAAVLAPAWRDGRRASGESTAFRLERRLALIGLTTLAIQIALGVVARHFDQSIHGVMTHAGFSVVALIFILAAAFRARNALASAAPAPRFAAAAVHAVGLQMILGLLALWQVLAHRESDPISEVLIATAHQVLGALVLGAMTLLTLWVFRLTRPADATQPAGQTM